MAVVAFSFRDSHVKSAADWDALYSRENGRLYGGITGGFASYLISENQITFANYFTDTRKSARQ